MGFCRRKLNHERPPMINGKMVADNPPKELEEAKKLPTNNDSPKCSEHVIIDDGIGGQVKCEKCGEWFERL